MQRVSNTILTIALITFLTAISLALISAAWLLTTHVLDGRSSLLPKWLLIGFLIVGFNQVNAQTSISSTYVVTDVHTRQSNEKVTVLPAPTASPDTLASSVQTTTRNRKRRISSKPAWPTDDSSVTEGPTQPDPSSVFYIMAVSPNPSTYKPGYWFRSRP